MTTFTIAQIPDYNASDNDDDAFFLDVDGLFMLPDDTEDIIWEDDWEERHTEWMEHLRERNDQ